MPDRLQPAPGRPSRAPVPPPYPAGQGTPLRGEEAGQPRVYPRPASQARDCTTPLVVPEPQVRQERGTRAQSHVEKINRAAGPVLALKESEGALTSVIKKAVELDPDKGAAWAWTAIYLIDGLNALVEHGRDPHPWFMDRTRHRLNPAGWAPPAPLAQVAARIAGRRPRNGTENPQ
jgi:hypothetical protein